MLKLLLFFVLVVITIRLISMTTRYRRNSGGKTSGFFTRRHFDDKNIVDAEFQDVTEKDDDLASGIDSDGVGIEKEESRD